jgi:hypothetical protein
MGFDIPCLEKGPKKKKKKKKKKKGKATAPEVLD